MYIVVKLNTTGHCAQALRRIRDQGTPQLWLEMTRQTQYPMVAIKIQRGNFEDLPTDVPIDNVVIVVSQGPER